MRFCHRWIGELFGILCFVTCMGSSMLQAATDKLVILSPHRKSIQQEFMPAFEAYYKKAFGKEIQVDWLDQGGASDDVRFLRARFGADPKSSGIDVFWGGGTAIYIDLANEGFLAPYQVPRQLRAELPTHAGSIPMADPKGLWHSSAMSSFGIFFNRKLLKFDGIPEPKLWTDLAKPVYYDNLTAADPRRSGSANTLNNIILQSLGFEKGFAVLTAMGGNTRSFTHSSSDPIKAVVSGDAAIATAIDFYATAKVYDLGEENLGFTLPENQTALDPDPIALLRGAPHSKPAERFLAFVLSKEAQNLWMLPKGAPGGPQYASLGRFAVNSKSYTATEGKRLPIIDPFNGSGFFKYDADQASKLQRVLNDLLGATIIDTHGELKEAWGRLRKDGMTDEELMAIGKSPVNLKELLALADRWQDNVLRNQTINEWVAFARAKYSQTQAH